VDPRAGLEDLEKILGFFSILMMDDVLPKRRWIFAELRGVK
jgi:hypothetical protein